MAEAVSIGVSDAELVALLELRDGPIPKRGRPHSAYGRCRYAELYDGHACPWCEAEARRSLTTAGGEFLAGR
jgi:hypothetical protein